MSDHRPGTRHRQLIGFACVAVLLATACSDTVGPSKNSPKIGALSVMLPPDGTVGDGDINIADTYFVMDISMDGSIDITSPDPFWDPGIQTYTNIVTVPMTAEEYHLEGGYDLYGNTLLDQWSNDDGAQGSGVALTHIYNDYTTMYDQFGNQIVDDGTQDLIGMTGSLINSIDPTQMVIPVSGGGGNPDDCPNNHPDCVVLEENMLVPLTPSGTPVTPGVPNPSTGPRREGWTVRGNVLEHTYADDAIAAPEALGDVVHLADGPAATDTLGGSHTFTSVTTYRKQGNNWVLDHTDEVTEHRARGFAMKISRHLRYSNVRALSNAKNETKRDSIRAATPIQRPHGVPHRALPVAGLTATGNMAMLGGTASVGGPSANLLTPIGRGNAVIAPRIASDLMVQPALGGTRALVLQHGIFSSEATWTSYMNGQLSALPANVGFSSIYIPSLTSTDPLESQVADLQGRVSSNGVGSPGTIYIGHSQGGLIARRLGQEQPDLVGGVVVIGTPNLGAPLLQNGPAAIAGTFGAIAANATFQTCYANYNGGLCDLTSIVSQYLYGTLIQYALQNAVPATSDLTPMSPFMFNING